MRSSFSHAEPRPSVVRSHSLALGGVRVRRSRKAIAHGHDRYGVAVRPKGCLQRADDFVGFPLALQAADVNGGSAFVIGVNEGGYF